MNTLYKKFEAHFQSTKSLRKPFGIHNLFSKCTQNINALINRKLLRESVSDGMGVYLLVCRLFYSLDHFSGKVVILEFPLVHHEKRPKLQTGETSEDFHSSSSFTN